MPSEEELLRRNEEVKKLNEKYREGRELRRLGYLPGDEELTKTESEKLAEYMEFVKDRKYEKRLFLAKWMTLGFLTGMGVCLISVLLR